MEKYWFQSKTIQGIILAAVGALWGIWSGETEISGTIVVAGFSWAGYGARKAMI